MSTNESKILYKNKMDRSNGQPPATSRYNNNNNTGRNDENSYKPYTRSRSPYITRSGLSTPNGTSYK